MPFYRKLIIILSSATFRLLLFFTISIIAGIIIYSNKNYIPSVLTRNNVYERLVLALLETNKDQSITVRGEVTLENPEIRQIITKAFPADELEKYSNKIIEATYSWLEQESPKLTFTVDLTQNKQRLAEGISIFAVNRLQGLPVCAEYTSEIDPFSATCRPANIDFSKEQQRIEQQFLTEAGFLEDPVITEESLFGDNKLTFDEQYKDLPTYYALVRSLPIYIALLLLALALTVIYASSTKKIGIRKIGKGLMTTGLSLIFFTVLFSFVLPSATGTFPLLQTSGQGVDGLLNDVAVDFGRDYAMMIVKISAPLVLLGTGMLVYAQSGRNKKNYNSAKLKSGVISGNEEKEKSSGSNRSRPPVQSSESSDTKPKRKLKNKKYRKIPKKEV